MAHVVSFSHPSDDSNRLGSFLSLFREEESWHQNGRSPGVLYEGTLGSRSIKKALVMHGASIFSMYWGWFLWFMCRKSMSQIFLRIWSFDWCEPFVGAKSVYGKLRFTSFASAPRVSWCLGWVCCGTFQSCITSCLHGSLRAPTQCLEIER